MERGKEIFAVRVNVNDSVEVIHVHENDEPSELIEKFSKNFSLSPEKKKLLEKEIEKKIDSLVFSAEKYQNHEKTNYTSLENSKITEKDDKFQENFNSISKMRTMGSLKISESNTLKKSFSKYNSSPFRSTSLYSSKITINKVKLHRFKTIFHYLNPNILGKINFEGISKLNLNQRLYKVVMPIICELEFSNQSLNYKEFCAKMEELLRKLNTHDIYYILSPNMHIPLYTLPNRHRISRANMYEHQIRGIKSLTPLKLKS